MKYLWLLTIYLYLTSCSDDDIHPVFNARHFLDEHNKTVWDSSSTISSLLGTWNWVYTYCCPEGSKQRGTSVADQKIQLRFSTSTVELIQNDEIVQTSTWFITPAIDENVFRIEVSPSISQLHGNILFAANMVLFYNSFQDGMDNYFEKINTTEGGD